MKKYPRPSSKITIADMRRFLGNDNYSIDDKEDIGTDKDFSDYSLNSSFSSDIEANNPEKPVANNIPLKRARSKPVNRHIEGDLEVTVDNLEEIISNPYIDMPEFYPNQLNFSDAEESKGDIKKPPSKNRNWKKIVGEVLKMSTSKIARPEYLNKILTLYLLRQGKLGQLENKQGKFVNSFEKPLFSKLGSNGNGFRYERPSHAPRPMRARRGITSTSLSRISSGINLIQKQSLANMEIQRKIERLDKLGHNFNIEDLARESKNILVRMPLYKKHDETVSQLADRDIDFMKMLCTYSINNGLLNRWKQNNEEKE